MICHTLLCDQCGASVLTTRGRPVRPEAEKRGDAARLNGRLGAMDVCRICLAEIRDGITKAKVAASSSSENGSVMAAISGRSVDMNNGASNRRAGSEVMR